MNYLSVGRLEQMLTLRSTDTANRATNISASWAAHCSQSNYFHSLPEFQNFATLRRAPSENGSKSQYRSPGHIAPQLENSLMSSDGYTFDLATVIVALSSSEHHS